MFNQNKNLIAPQEYFHFSNRFAQEKLIAHSGFVASAGDGTNRQAYDQQIAFNDWFWGGGFLILISYAVIIAGTCVFINHLFSLVKEKKQNYKKYV